MKYAKLILAVLLGIYSNAQTTFAPLNAIWNYDYVNHNGTMTADWTIKVVNDSLINGHPTKFLKRTSYITSSLPPDPPTGTVNETDFGVLQLRNDSVFYYPITYPNNELFLYSFVMNVGDTLVINPSYPDLFAVVDTIYDTIIGSNTLSTIKFTKYCSDMGSPVIFGQTQIIQDIGPIDDFLLWNTDGCPIGNGSWSFQCYASSSINYNQPCTAITLGIHTLESQNVSIYPVPTNDYCTIELDQPSEDVEIILIDQLGKSIEISSKIDDSSIILDLRNIASGSYILRVQTESFILSKTIIKQ